jgi:DNA-directed RNA polymerase subunit alpha
MSVAVDLTGLVLPETVDEQSRSDDESRAQFLLQPLERGFGHTIGNSIRRILLSSLPGSAVWAFRADGVQHEHQTMEGVVEDIHQIIQNIKQIVLVLDSDVEEAKLEMSILSAGVVKAGQITPHAGVAIKNPDLTLFTLQEDMPDNRPLNIDFWVNTGRGFVMADQHSLREDAPVGMIRIDSIYNPVVGANFTVTETRVGGRTDFDRLVVDVTTNGAMDPATAVRHAAEIARVHLGYFAMLGDEIEVAIGSEDGAGQARLRLGDDQASVLDQPIEAFEQISARSRNTLEKENIRYLADVVSLTRDEMLQVPNFGEKSLEEVAEVLATHGLRFGMPLERDDEGNLYLAEELVGNGAGEAEAEHEA